MQVKLTVRYVSGREEQFEIEVETGKSGEFRLKEFVKDPSLLLRTDGELILIPAGAIECLSLAVPKTAATAAMLENVRAAKRLK
jgi:hypothetical protein